MKSTKENYSRMQIILHWSVAILILYQLIFSDYMKYAYWAFLNGKEYSQLAVLSHVIPGLLVLALTLYRFFVRMRRGAPEPVKGTHPMMEMLAKLIHWEIYALLVAVPVSGMMTWGGEIRAAAEWHETLFSVMMFLIVIHIAAALYHHFVKKDGLIRRMMKAA